MAEEHVHIMQLYLPTMTERCIIEGCGLELSQEEVEDIYREWLKNSDN